MFCGQCGQWAADGSAACARCGAALAPGAVLAGVPGATPPRAAELPEVRYAGFWRRLCAWFIDSLVLWFPLAIARVAMGGDVWGDRVHWDDPLALRLAGFNFFAALLYCVLLESSRWQGTLGHQVVGVRVCDGQLRRVSVLRALGRFLCLWLSVSTCGIGYLTQLWTRRRQTLHDLVAGCVIVRSDSLDALGRTERA